MANQEHVDIVRSGDEPLEEWIEANPGTRLDLSGADLRGIDLFAIEMEGADLTGANLADASVAHVEVLAK